MAFKTKRLPIRDFCRRSPAAFCWAGASRFGACLRGSMTQHPSRFAKRCSQAFSRGLSWTVPDLLRRGTRRMQCSTSSCSSWRSGRCGFRRDPKRADVALAIGCFRTSSYCRGWSLSGRDVSRSYGHSGYRYTFAICTDRVAGYQTRRCRFRWCKDDRNLLSTSLSSAPPASGQCFVLP